MHAAVLRYFDHVARHGSIRKAADALSVASSAVNRQILRLEDEMGVALFERGRGGVRPTAAGELLLRHVRETQNEYQRVCAEIASLSGAISGNVRIIALESILARFLPDIVAEVTARHPKVNFTVLTVDPGKIAGELRSGDNDFGVVFIDHRLRGVEIVAEFQTAIGALMRPDHPLAGSRGLTLTANSFASAFFTMTGFHGLHVLGGLILLTIVLYRAARGQFSSQHHVGVAAVTLYWHFVDVVWIFLFGILYLGVTAFR